MFKQESDNCPVESLPGDLSDESTLADWESLAGLFVYPDLLLLNVLRLNVGGDRSLTLRPNSMVLERCPANC